MKSDDKYESHWFVKSLKYKKPGLRPHPKVKPCKGQKEFDFDVPPVKKKRQRTKKS